MTREHGPEVARMFGRIAGWYDFLNHFLSLGLDISWRRELVQRLDLPSDGPCLALDLAAGTLDVSLEILRRCPACRVVGADFCLPMLRQGQSKLAARGITAVSPVQADGLTLPFAPDSFQAATVAFGIRNIKPRQAAFAELYRVLKPGGRLGVLEFGSGRQRIWGGLYNFYLNRVLPGIAGMFSRDPKAYAYLAQTIRDFPPAWDLAQEMRQAGFSRVRYQPLASGIVFLHWASKEPD